MSTRGYVGRLNEDGTVDAIYNHFDSYYDGLGKNLIDFFDTKEKVDKLIRRGHGSNVIDEEGYKDNDETCAHFDTEKDFENFIDEDIFIEYGYLFKDGKWFGKNHLCGKQWVTEDEKEKYFWKFTPVETILEEVKTTK